MKYNNGLTKQQRRFSVTDGQYLLMLDTLRESLRERADEGDDSLFCSPIELKEFYELIAKRHEKEIGGGI